MALHNLFLFFLLGNLLYINVGKATPVDYLATAEEMLTAIKNKEDMTIFRKTFELANEDQLAVQLGNDEQKIAFWVNIYNAYIQDILSKNPEKYNDRGIFFKSKQIHIAGRLLSFADIEHGILRRSQHEFFLGYLTRPFVSEFEKKFRVNKRDYRIHFALNCGAKSCPPVAIYEWTRLSDQLDKSTKVYLTKFTELKEKEKTAYVTSLFSWFRGDFGGLDGIRNILLKLDLIPDKDTRLKTASYDWTLDLGNFIAW
jgi:Protein of unknown function, DUF547